MNGLETITEELNRLSLSLDYLDEEHRNSVLKVVNQRVKSLLKARIVDVRWKGELNPGAGGILLQPIYSSTPNPKPYFVNEQSQGVWSWLYHNRKPVWLENLHERAPNEPWPNKADNNENMDPKYLTIDPATNTIISLPLVYGESTDVVWGAFTVEWGADDTPDEDTLKGLISLARPIGRIVWKADLHMIDRLDTRNAIDLLDKAVATAGTETVLNKYRSGFYVRPFDAKYVKIENFIGNYLHAKKIQVQRFVNPGGGRPVINDIIKMIRMSHFGIVDITGLNPNVLVEVGMLLGLKRQVMLIKEAGDAAPTPFNLSAYEIHKYQVLQEGAEAEPTVEFYDPGANNYVPAEQALGRFLEELRNHEGFRKASPWEPED